MAFGSLLSKYRVPFRAFWHATSFWNLHFSWLHFCGEASFFTHLSSGKKKHRHLPFSTWCQRGGAVERPTLILRMTRSGSWTAYPQIASLIARKKQQQNATLKGPVSIGAPKHFGVESFTLRTKTLSLIGEQKSRLDEIGFRPAWTLSVEVPLRSLGICRLSIYFDHAQF